MRSSQKVDCAGYDFVDFGCSNGGSLTRYSQLLNARGLGLDIDPEKVEMARNMGLDAQVADLTRLRLGSTVSFAVMSHFLEHIPSTLEVRKIIRRACENVSDFILIRQPYFDADAYLFSIGLKLYWSNWSGHPNNMTALEFHNILSPIVKDGLAKSFNIYGKRLITDSSDHAIHNLDSPINQHDWTQGKHSEKKIRQFDVPVFQELIVVIDINGKSTERVEKKLRPDEQLYPILDKPKKRWSIFSK